MISDYFSDRETTDERQLSDAVSEGAWGGIVSLIERAITTHMLAESFPEICEDSPQVFGCDRASLANAIRAEIPSLDWPLDSDSVPAIPEVMDAIEFVYENISSAQIRGHHSYFRHDHLTFDKPAGQREFREQVNRIFRRNALAFELTDTGAVRRIGSRGLERQLKASRTTSGDEALEALLESAVTKISSPDPTVRREALEKLWDAFERLKTVFPGDKKQASTLLIAEATRETSSAEAELISDEMKLLTGIGNSFQIRHYETHTEEVNEALVDMLFARMFALIQRLIPAAASI